MGYPYTSDPEWADVTGIAQDDGPEPVCPIAYSPQFVQTMDYFRAILAMDEQSARALQLTEDVIDQNSANYTAWHHRRKCLAALSSDLRRELAFIEEAVEMTPKNYQLWHHRRTIVALLADECASVAADAVPSGSARRAAVVAHELKHTADVLADDAKNYHIWSHRQWVLTTFADIAFENELDFTDSLLAADVRNNSAWNQRHFVHTHHTPAGATPFSASIIDDELSYAETHLRVVPHNDSAWNYVLGLLAKPAATRAHRRRVASFAANEVLSSTTTTASPECAQALSALVDVYEQLVLGARDGDDEQAQRERDVAAALDACDVLASRVDVVRCRYWTFRRDTLSSMAAQ